MWTYTESHLQCIYSKPGEFPMEALIWLVIMIVLVIREGWNTYKALRKDLVKTGSFLLHAIAGSLSFAVAAWAGYIAFLPVIGGCMY
jgi:hypothetical protein